MSLDPPWAVLAPGAPAWLEQRARAALGLDEDEVDEVEFKIVRGDGRYHAIIGTPESVGDEETIAEQLSLECAEPVYSIFGSWGAEDPALVYLYRKGVRELVEAEPQELARHLECPFPEPPATELPPPLKTVALVEGVPAQEALRALEESEIAEGFPVPPGRFRILETAGGLLIAGGTAPLAAADIRLAERLPQAIVHSVTAAPSLDGFVVSILRGGKNIGRFARPPDDWPFAPAVSEIKGESSPERILAALGIPVEWFQY